VFFVFSVGLGFTVCYSS